MYIYVKFIGMLTANTWIDRIKYVKDEALDIILKGNDAETRLNILKNIFRVAV